MRLNRLPTGANVCNWILAAVLASSVIDSLLQVTKAGWAGITFALLYGLLLAGVLLRAPIAYIGVLTLSLLSLALALHHENLLYAAIAATFSALAWHVRCQLHSADASPPGDPTLR